jgi:hypothetical protein
MTTKPKPHADARIEKCAATIREAVENALRAGVEPPALVGVLIGSTIGVAKHRLWKGTRASNEQLIELFKASIAENDRLERELSGIGEPS